MSDLPTNGTNGKRLSVSEEILDLKLEALDERQQKRFEMVNSKLARVYLVIGLTFLGGQGIAAADPSTTTRGEAAVKAVIKALL